MLLLALWASSDSSSYVPGLEDGLAIFYHDGRYLDYRVLPPFCGFTIYESPKFLMGKGRDEEAVRVVHEVARRNVEASSCEFP